MQLGLKWLTHLQVGLPVRFLSGTLSPVMARCLGQAINLSDVRVFGSAVFPFHDQAHPTVEHLKSEREANDRLLRVVEEYFEAYDSMHGELLICVPTVPLVEHV